MPSYNHNLNGINLANFRSLNSSGRPARAGVYDASFRASYDWTQETLDQMGLTGVENRMSTTLRSASHALQAEATALVNTDINAVEAALRTKIQQTETLKSTLDAAMTEVANEVDQLAALRRALDSRLSRISEKLGVASARLQTRKARPAREMTLDDVEKSLRMHEGLLISTVDKITRAVMLVEKESVQLQTVATALAADAKDKARAIKVDGSVLSVDSAGRPGMLPELHPRNPDSKSKTPFTWSSRSADNVASAKHWVADSQRLRKAISHVLHNSKVAEHEVSRSLNNSLMGKMNETTALKKALEAELESVKSEQTRASGNRAKLAAALQAQRGPLTQAKQRLELRKHLPSREHVADDVESALMAEVAHLSSITAKLGDKVLQADKELAALSATALMLEANIADKEVALHVDEAVAMADGRLGLASPPPSSAGSLAWSASSVARDATLMRIQDLERELMTARAEREDLEASIRAVKASWPVEA